MTHHDSSGSVAQQLAGTSDRVRDTQPVEAKPAQAPARRPLPRQWVQRDRLGHARVERGIEGGYLGYAREACPRGVNAGHRRRIVQRGQLGQLGDLVPYRVVHADGLPEAHAPVDHAVAYRLHRRRSSQRGRELGRVAVRFGAFPARLALLLGGFGVRVQHHPFEAAGAGIEHQYRSLLVRDACQWSTSPSRGG